MAIYTAFANYVVYFADLDEYNFAVSMAGTEFVKISPKEIADTFGFVDGVNFNIPGGGLHPQRGMYTLQYSLSDPGDEILHPGPSGIFMSWLVPSRLVPGQDGNPPGEFSTANELLLIWAGTIIKVGVLPDLAPVPKRRWIGGFEYQILGEGGSSGGSDNRSRSASRTLDGIGYGLSNRNNTNWLRALNEYSTPDKNYKSWERFYIQIKTPGTGNFDIWRSVGNPSPNASISLQIKPDLSLDVFNVSSAGAFTLLDNIPAVFNIDQWYQFNILIRYNNAAEPGDGQIRIFLGKTLIYDRLVTPAEGGIGGTNQTHTQSRLGTIIALSGNLWEVNFDDWHNAEIPELFGVESLTSLDWMFGTHVKRVWINAGTTVNWTGQVQSMNSSFFPTNAQSFLISGTALAVLTGLTNLDNEQDPLGPVIAHSSTIISKEGFIASGTVSGQLGYSLAGDTPVMAPITESGTASARTVMYQGTGTDEVPQDIVPLVSVYEKANSAINSTVRSLSAVVEHIGVWGKEDSPQAPDVPKGLLHNSWFPNIAWAFTGPVNDGPVAVKTGTYVGNGTVQSIQLPWPCHFLWVRPTTLANISGAKWFNASLGGHRNVDEAVTPDSIIRVDFDSTTLITAFTVVGTDNRTNQNGVTYQYVAFCDPAMQYNICGAFIHSSTFAAANNPLITPTFIPEAAFFNYDTLSTSSAVGLRYKGPGHTANQGTTATGVDQPNLATLSPGMIVSRTNAHNANNNQTNYSVWRSRNNCGDVMVQIYSYTGDGTASRVINSTPASGRFPCFVYVQPHNAMGFAKDPSSPTNTSRSITTGTESTTAITAAGIDTITVGITLNANGIVYDVFIFPGDNLGFNNGTFFPPNCAPDGFGVDPEDPGGINILPNGGLLLNGAVPLTLLKDVSGIYTLVPGKTDDTLYDRQTGQPEIDVAIPDPNFKTGYVGG